MTSSAGTLKAFTDAAADAIARSIAGMQREAQMERELRDAEHRARLAELDARIAAIRELEGRVTQRLAEVRDGRDGKDGIDGKDGRDGVDGVSPDAQEICTIIHDDCARIAAEVARVTVDAWTKPRDGRDGVDGKDADPEMIRAMIAEAIAEMPKPQDGAPGRDGKDGRDGIDGKDGRDGVDGQNGRDGADGAPGRDGLDGKDGDRGPEGPVGKLPQVREWSDGVHYEGDVVTFDGSVFQALRDTGKVPPHEDWRCIVSRGAAGPEGRSPNPRGTYASDATYAQFDFVMLGGSSFIARHDDPGPCPGEGWQLLASGGSKGKAGERGDAGRPGAPGPGLRAIRVDDHGLLSAVNADGTTVECDLYPLLSKLGR